MRVPGPWAGGLCVAHGPAAAAARAGRHSGRIVSAAAGAGAPAATAARRPAASAPRSRGGGGARGRRVPGADAPLRAGAGTRGGRCGWLQLWLLRMVHLDATEGPFFYAVNTEARIHLRRRRPRESGCPGVAAARSSRDSGPRSPSAKAVFRPFVVAGEGVAAAPGVLPVPRDREVHSRCPPPVCRSLGKFRGLLFLPF